MSATSLVALHGAHAAPRLASIFSDHMVVQRDARVPVWGWADPGERITVAFKGQAVSAAADSNGRWRVVLDPIRADDTPASMVVAGETTIAIEDVLVGEVWLASGQSNMEWQLRRSDRAESEVAAADFSHVREFAVGRATASAPAHDCVGVWSVCTPAAAGEFSAVAYYFAREVYAQLGVPVGIVKSVWGGTPVEAWTSLPALAREPELINLFVRWERALGEYPERRAEHDAALAVWEAARAEARKAGASFTQRRPPEPLGPQHPHRPANLFNAMIHPVAGFAIRGAIWYQGESNAANPDEYAVSFPTMIRDWRAWWDNGVFPFYFVQLANYRDRVASGGNWPWLREVQTKTLAVANTGMAVTIDIGDSTDIHPRNKKDVGRRLARLALNRTYGIAMEDSGPVFDSLEVRGGGARVTFTHTTGGLQASGEKLTGFAIAGPDRVFRPADARIEGDATVVVTHPEVPAPVAVRYAWDNDPNPPATLYNGEGLPAVPFRTDNWPRLE